MAVIKAECNEQFKDKVKSFIKKKGESEAAIVRKALKKYMDNDTIEAPK